MNSYSVNERQCMSILALPRKDGLITGLTKSLFQVVALLMLLVLFMNPAGAQLAAGQNAPLFKADAAFAGQPYQFNLGQALAHGPVVVYFYPKAFTAGCTIEAQMFAEHAEQFKALNATVIGVSGDDIDTLKRFSEGPCGGKFAVAADANRSIMKAYDASRKIQSGMADRISYVIAPDTRIIAVYSGISPVAHVESTLAALENWQDQHAPAVKR